MPTETPQGRGGEEPMADWRDVLEQTHEEPRPGSGFEQEVVLTLRQAYRGVTCQYTDTLPNGKKHTVKLKVPPGVDTGTRVRFAGQGKRGHAGGAPGDHYLVIQVRQHPRFARRGNDLYHECFTNLAELALGGEIRIRTLDGKLLGLTIPAGTLPGQRFRLTGQGMPHLHQPECRGDLYVTVNATLPRGVKITDQQTSREEVKTTKQQTPQERQTSPQEDDSGELVFIAMLLTALFLAGIGTGLLLYWLILE
jgi:DnaJ-class molecular chaperone